ncbi:MAG: TetR/AcrR family transcriptional regulator [Fusobacterium sp.]
MINMKEEKDNSTKDKIISAAIDLFAELPYEKVSIAQICKNAGVSNGIIYTYFKNKIELFQYLLEEVIRRIEHYFENIEGNDIKERLESYININLELTKKEFKIIRIYRAGQYKFIEYEKKIKIIYINGLEKVFNRRMEIYESFFLLSGIRFINIFYTANNLECDVKFLVKILLYGFLGEFKISIKNFNEMSFFLRVPFNSSSVKCLLLEKGTEIFMKKDFFDIKILDITKAASISSGNFYNYFSSKDEFFKEIIVRFKKQLFYFLKDNYKKEFLPNENHVMFLYLMLEYFKDSYYKDKIMREAEFIAPELYFKYLNKDFNFYLETLDELNYSFERKKIIVAILLGIAHYMRIEFFYTKNIANKEEFLEKISYFLKNGVSL